MAGFRHAFRAHTDPHTPLFGFAEAVEVSPLVPHDAKNMIRLPLNNLGLSLPDVMVESILQESASHPQLVSVLCSQILRFVDAEGCPPTIEDFEPEIVRSGDFERRMLQSFLASTTVFEMSACLLLVRRAKDRGEAVTNFEFDFWIVKDLLAKARLSLDAKAVMTICHNLRLSSVITTISGRSGIEGRLRFFIPQLVKVIANMDLNALLQDTLEEARRRQKDWTAVFDERDVESAERLFASETARKE